MAYRDPAGFASEYAEAHSSFTVGEFGERTTLDTVTVVSATPDTARIEALWFTYGHDPDSGYYDVSERTAFILVKRHDGWHLQSEENLGYE